MPPLNKHLTLTAQALAILASLFLVCCADDSALPCSFDSECPTDQACVSEFCRPLCQRDNDCKDVTLPDSNEKAICRAFTRSSISAEAINVCAPPDTVVVDPKKECSTDTQCQTQLGDEGARCSILRTCIIAPEVTGVLIRDLSQTGAEILAIQLERSGQRFADHIVEEYIPADQTSPQPTMLPTNTFPNSEPCPTTEGKSTPLNGKDGTLRVHFKRANGQRIEVQPGDRVVVVERGSQCGMNQSSEEYQAFLCVSRSGDRLNSASQCTKSLGTAQTERSSWLIP